MRFLHKEMQKKRFAGEPAVKNARREAPPKKCREFAAQYFF